MIINEKQLVAVLGLPAPKRYSNFIKTVVDCEEAWGLYDSGWAMLESPNGHLVFPLWPAKEYANYCAIDTWANYIPKSISLNTLIVEFLPQLQNKGIVPGVFYTPEQGSVDVTMNRLIDDLQEEMKNY